MGGLSIWHWIIVLVFLFMVAALLAGIVGLTVWMAKRNASTKNDKHPQNR